MFERVPGGRMSSLSRQKIMPEEEFFTAVLRAAAVVDHDDFKMFEPLIEAREDCFFKRVLAVETGNDDGEFCGHRLKVFPMKFL